MKNSTILIAVGADVSMHDLGQRLEAIRDIQAHAEILIVGETPAFPYYGFGMSMYGTTVIPEDWQIAVTERKAALKAKVDEIETLLRDHDVSGSVSAVAAEPSLLADAVSQHAMVCDAVLVSDELRASDVLFRQTVFGVLFQSPVGVFLNATDTAKALAPERVFIAWNTHLHTARAVHEALPLLKRAKEVNIATIDAVTTEYRDGEDPGADVAKWLAHHGCNVVVNQYSSGGKDIGASILQRAKDTNADLVVMGSYSHSKTREALFGGTTSTLLEQTDQTVYIAH